MGNYDGTMGLLMNNEAYTAYPEEGELLLPEGKKVYILKIEEGVKIKNTHKGMQQFSDKTITIVYLYDSDDYY